MRFDTESPYRRAHGVYSPDRGEALVAFAVLATGTSLTPPPLLLPGLEPTHRYRVESVAVPGQQFGPSRTQSEWVTDGATATGAALATLGIQPPVLHPESAVLIHLRA